jgi:nucleotide-binding universal stress UspA family protein
MKDKQGMKILLAYDGSECAEAALIDLQRAGLPSQVEARVLSIAEELIPAPASFGGVTTSFRQDELAEQQKALALARQTCARLHGMFPAWELAADAGIGSPGSHLLAYADEWQPDLLVVGSHGRSALGRFFFGNVSQKLVNEARCSVRVARGRVVTPADTPVRLVAGVDGSAGAAAAIAQIAARTWPSGTEIQLVNAAWTLPPVGQTEAAIAMLDLVTRDNERVQQLVNQAAETLRAAGLAVTTTMLEEEPKRLLCAEAERLNADCIFLGAQGMGRLERTLTGSVAAGVAARAHCSVEIVRG